jgi:NADH dehydrogenase [ubiquinone] 1 alpha subcomplex assembly factor 5
MIAPQPAQRGGSAKSSAHRAQVRSKPATIVRLSRETPRRTSAGVPDLFDMKLRTLRRGHAARGGPELFLLDRTFDDCLERIALLQRRFARALLIGCPDPAWPKRLGEVANMVDTTDPNMVEDQWRPPAVAYDLVLAIGTLDTVNDLPLALRLARHAMVPGGLFIGAFSGGDTLPRLRAAMRAADAVAGGASPHVHPRIDASAVAPLLEQAGLLKPVVDVDRVQVSYRSLGQLVTDLRAMAATNILVARPRFMTKAARAAAIRAFAEAGDGERTADTFEIIHFAAWAAGKS